MRPINYAPPTPPQDDHPLVSFLFLLVTVALFVATWFLTP